MTRPIGIDLFSGAGGLSLGFEQAGFDVVAAVEYDPIHAAVHKFNFPQCTVLARSVSGLQAVEIRKAANIGNRTVDVVFGGAPCQGFSMIGHRILDDPRNSLVREFVRIVQDLKANYFVFENVKGLTIGRHRKFLDELIAAFRDIGYAVQVPWKVLNASSFGVPQNRERLILLGARKGMPLPQYPAPLTLRAGLDLSLPGLDAGPTCQDALDDLPDVERFRELIEKDWVRYSRWRKPSAYARAMRCQNDEGWYYGYRRRWDPNVLTSSARTHHTIISRQRFSETQEGEVEPISRFFKLPSVGVANTLRAGTDSARGAFTSPRPIHYRYSRCITVREMARLHGFPDWFRFHVTKWHGARQIGNAVPPPLARAIAKSLMAASGQRFVKPARPQSLGDPMLLQLNMAEASRYWGIPVPIGRRDRKSGARKRKQTEIEATRVKALSYA